MANIDERLMGNTLRPEQEPGAARELKGRRSGGGDEEGETGKPRSLRQRVQAARQTLDLKARAKKKIEEKITAPAKIGTSKLLQQAWINLIDSFGLTLIWINIHVFLRLVLGEKLFCKLGEEWIPKQISGAGGEAGKMANKSIGIVEVMGLAFLDLIVFFAIIGVIALLVWLADNLFLKVIYEAGQIVSSSYEFISGK